MGRGVKRLAGIFWLINKRISFEAGEKTMTLLEQFIEEGKIEVAERLLMEKVKLTFIAKVTGLSLAKIKEIQKNPKPPIKG